MVKVRKSPVRHIVHAHKRQGKTIQKYPRGKGQKQFKIATPTIQKPTLKHYIVKYKCTFKDGTFNFDTTNCFVNSEKDIIKDLEKSFITPPKIEIVKVELQSPPEKRLKPLLDVDTRTRSRMEKGYILDYIQIKDINLPPLRSKERLEDNLKQMKDTQATPPVHLSPAPNGRFEIEDGVHRIYAAKELGYKSIPALINYGG